MRFVVVDFWIDRDDPVRIDAVMAKVIVAHDVLHSNCFSDTGPLIKFTGKAPKVGIINQTPAVTFEMQMIDRVKPDQGGEQPPIGLGFLFAIR